MKRFNVENYFDIRAYLLDYLNMTRISRFYPNSNLTMDDVADLQMELLLMSSWYSRNKQLFLDVEDKLYEYILNNMESLELLLESDFVLCSYKEQFDHSQGKFYHLNAEIFGLLSYGCHFESITLNKFFNAIGI